eukprot:gene25163-30389_t
MEEGGDDSSRSSGENHASQQHRSSPLETAVNEKRASDEHDAGGLNDGSSDRNTGSALTPSNIIKTAILSKKGRAKFIRPWALRKIVVDEENRLFYYDRNDLKGVVSLVGTGIRHLKPEQADGRNFAFEIFNINDGKGTSRKSNLILAAGSMLEANDWVDSIGALLSRLHRVKSMEYQSLGDLAKQNINAAAPLDIKKLKEQRKKAAAEEEDEESEDDVQEDVAF